ncbi:calcium-activated chloride channel regulator 1-like [Dermacentor andersoni]|uniref:calcium-activated chloride channel regulator 1-like n=1 Tax=Dermacentor andersoni TaxID=34620 RepID=UPI003B3BE140
MGVSQGTLAATLWFFCLASAIATDIDERDGGYINILVSIEPEVPPDENIIRNLKALLESSSRFLHRATNGRVYFKSFNIEVPKHWPKRKVDRHLGATQFLNSDVRIVSSKSCGFQEPCTVTSQGCQEKGDYVFIPAEYLQHLGPLTAETNESAAYTFVHEWAHLRYGVFDEYGTRGDDSFPETYCVDGEVQLSACSENIPFTANLKNGSPCPTDEKCHFGEDCIVKPYIGHKTLAESSIMFMPHVKNLSYFCESTNKKRRLHNSAAPTKQNNMCGGASVLDVILKSDDFKDLADANPLKHVGVTFKEWQERADRPQKIVLTLDVSGSMWLEEKRLKVARQAAKDAMETENSAQLEEEKQLKEGPHSMAPSLEAAQNPCRGTNGMLMFKAAQALASARQKMAIKCPATADTPPTENPGSLHVHTHGTKTTKPTLPLATATSPLSPLVARRLSREKQD